MLRPFDVVMCIGKRGSGKSSRAKALLLEELRGGGRALVFDVWDEYSRHGAKTPMVELGPLATRATVDELLAHPQWLRAKDLSLAVVPDSQDGDELASDLADLLEVVRDSSGGFVFALDEVGLYEERAYETLNVIATQSRHYGRGVPVVLVAQRAVQVPKTAREQVSILFTGQQTSPEDLDALTKLTGATLGKEGAQGFAAKVSKLKRPGILEWRDDS